MIAVPIPELADLFSTIIFRAVLTVALSCALCILVVIGAVAGVVHEVKRWREVPAEGHTRDDYDEVA